MVFVVVISVIIFANPADASAQTVSFDQKPYVIEHSGIIYVTDISLPPAPIATVSNTRTSESITISLTGDGVGNYVGKYIKFTAGSTNADTQTLNVRADDTVQVDYGGITDTAVIKAASGLTQSWSNRRADTTNTNCNSYGGDSDSDGICTWWEDGHYQANTLYINNPLPTGTDPPYKLQCVSGALYSDDPSGATICPDPNIKDIYIEVDYMQGHHLDKDAIKHLTDTFIHDPREVVHLHIQLDVDDSTNIVHTADTPFPGGNTATTFGFDQIKAKYFGTPTERGVAGWGTTGWKEKKQVFHYALIVHKQRGFPTQTGNSEVQGNDLIITLGSTATQVGVTDQQEGTFMHELGHNLNLHHGGAPTDTRNCKPNYISVMSYSRQFSDLVSDRELNYSKKVIGPTPLNEQNLIEDDGISSYTPHKEVRIVYGPTPPLILPWTGGQVDWDVDGTWHETITSGIDINNLASGICGPADGLESFSGYDDWNSLTFSPRANGNNLADGRRVVAGDITPCNEDVEGDDGQPACPQVQVSLEETQHDGIKLLPYSETGDGINLIAYVTPKSEMSKSIIRDKICGDKLCSEAPKEPTTTDTLAPEKGPTIENPFKMSAQISSRELRMEDVIGFRVSRIDSLDKAIANLNDSGFNGDASSQRHFFAAKLDDIRDNIKNDMIESATVGLYEIRATMDGSVGEDSTDDRIEPSEQKMLLAGVDDIIASEKKAAAYIDPVIVPEFGPIAALVFAIALISIIAVSKRTRFLFPSTS